MTNSKKTPIYRDDDHELLGFIVEENNSWVARTFFGYTIERTTSQKAAEAIVRQQGLMFLTGMWQYFDKDEKDWFPCVLKEANQHQVIVIRTDRMGNQDPDEYKIVTLVNPTENTLIKTH